MRKTEQRLWDRMRQHIAPRGILLERVENAVGEGMPDVMVLCGGVFTPTELKAVESPPARPDTRLIPSGKGLSVEQRNWHLAWQQNGGRSLIVVGCGRTAILAVEGKYADDINGWSLQQMSRFSVAATWSELAWHYGSRPKP
jgi:hypothetical protein